MRLLFGAIRRVTAALTFSAVLGSCGWAQSASSPSSVPQPPQQPAPAEQASKNSPEMSTQEGAATFKVRVNLVEVRVVVLDAFGKAVTNLKREDFQLLDNGKPQTISKFSVEQAGARPPIHRENPPENTTASATGEPLPERYLAYLFDDIHLTFSDLATARAAADRQLQSLDPDTRVALFTTSGQGQLDFTDDRAAIRQAMARILPRTITGSGTTDCPNISYYLADLIVNQHDLQALRVAVQDAVDCGAVTIPSNSIGGASQTTGAVTNQVQNLAARELSNGEHESHIAMDTLNNVVRRLSVMPGQRNVVMISPGFIYPEHLDQRIAVEDRALHSGVVINTLDARGLYTVGVDASQQRSPSVGIAPLMLQYAHQEAQADDEVLSDLADATGGTFVHNTNDMDAGLRRITGTPEVSYLLGFTPANLKLDGSFHKLKVMLKQQSFKIQARKGYYAPKQASDAAEESKQEISDAVFSQEERNDIPVQMHTQFFKSGEDDVKLSLLIKLDVRHLPFRKADGRNNENITVVSAVFDRNGNFISGNQKVLQMHLKDETLASKLNNGVTVKTSFDVKPGNYVVRLVVRDDEGAMAAQNTAVEIP